ncbi:hypothetical protein PIB30_039694 [Stylosanthes scabra]|uniref:Uncharacterized protein n=1 Tax=Stylosanthes scabra TaxID=79078 RepID=A0ABU6XE00_9FABA|nr:hypothetical protein [Stylosanthes scabra]
MNKPEFCLEFTERRRRKRFGEDVCYLLGGRIVGEVQSGKVVKEDDRRVWTRLSEFVQQIHDLLDFSEGRSKCTVLSLCGTMAHGGLLRALPRDEVRVEEDAIAFVDLWSSGSHAQSESEKMVNLSYLLLWNCNVSDCVPDKYLRTCLTASQCSRQGFAMNWLSLLTE